VSPDFEARAAESVLAHGFVILPKLIPEERLEKLKRPILEQVEHVDTLLKEKGAKLNVGSAHGFHEVCLRSPGRLDIPRDPAALDKSLVSPLEGIASRVLGGHADLQSEKTASSSSVESTAGTVAVCAYMGIVRGEPGCPAQDWHADSPHIEGPHHGPPNMLNMLVSLKDCPVELGPTELVPNSHVLTNHLRDDARFQEHTLVYQRAENSPELVGSRHPPIVAQMAAGSALIFDDRVLHRGGRNESDSKRDMAFLSYHREGYSTPTYYESSRSLLTYDHRSLAESVRAEFPGLTRAGSDGDPCSSGNNATRVILADGASGSQFHKTVIEGMVDQMTYGTANLGGNYASSRNAEKAMVNMRSAMADFLNCAGEEIALGASMTAVTYSVARALRNSVWLRPGDNIVLDPMSHGANVWTWVQLANACGVEVRWLKVGDGLVLDSGYDALSAVIDNNTRFVAVGYASNGVGSVHDVKAICAAAKELSNGRALRFVDAVHYAPHGRVDVQSIACDFLVCSPYKFFGPHSGILYGRKQLLETLAPDRLDCQTDALPTASNCNMTRWEVGTQSYETAAGITAAVDYIAGLGDRFGGTGRESSRATRLDCAWRAIAAHESDMKTAFLEGAAEVRGLHILGVTDVAQEAKRTATFAVAKDGLTAEELTDSLCEKGIWCTYGNHYAGFWSDHSNGLVTNDTGITRLGFLHYNTIAEVQEVVKVLADL
jgi:cysteine desulfurase family protein (TIGR01976 family)